MWEKTRADGSLKLKRNAVPTVFDKTGNFFINGFKCFSFLYCSIPMNCFENSNSSVNINPCIVYKRCRSFVDIVINAKLNARTVKYMKEGNFST